MNGKKNFFCSRFQPVFSKNPSFSPPAGKSLDMRSCNQNLSISCCFTGNKLKFCPEAPSLSVSYCVKSAARKPLVQTARFNLILRQDKLYKAAFSAPVSRKKEPCNSLISQKEGLGSPSKRRRKPPRSPPKEGGGPLLVPPGRKASEAALFFSKGGPRNSPHFTSLPASFLPSRKGLFPAFLSLLCKKRPGSSLSPPVKISSGLREGRAARKIPGLNSGFRLRVFRPACGGSGLYRRNVRTRSVKFSVRPAGGFRTIPEECPEPICKVFRPARGRVQAYPACGAYRRMKKETGESPVSLGFGWGRRQTRRSRGPAVFFRVRGAQPSSEELWAAS